MGTPRKTAGRRPNQDQGEKQEVDLSAYVEVKDRIVEFREKYPDGRLRAANPEQPYDIIAIGGENYVAYTALAYRDPDDKLPGVGTAWELIPGKTKFTRGSELQNAETSAWGRAMVAALVVDAHKGISSADEVRGRERERETGDAPPQAVRISKPNQEAIIKRCVDNGLEVAAVVRLTTEGRTEDPAELFTSEVPAARDIVADMIAGKAMEAGEEPPGDNPFTREEGPHDEAFA